MILAGNEAFQKQKIIFGHGGINLDLNLITLLNPHFQVLECTSTDETYYLARQVNPVLIISTVDKAERTALGLCKWVKSDYGTRHIPLVFFMKGQNREHMLKCLEAGADDCIAEPYDIKLIKARLLSLIRNREFLLKPSLTYNTFSAPGHVLMPKEDTDLFLVRAKRIVQKHISDESFTILKFCREIGMSRSRLHLKLKKATNLSTTAFINQIRLENAIELLESRNYNISEVAINSGFNNVSYFNRCFRKLYNLTPSQYCKKSDIPLKGYRTKIYI